MSKGYGVVQRSLLMVFGEYPDCEFSVYELAQLVYDKAKPNAEELTSTDRALRSLTSKVSLCKWKRRHRVNGLVTWCYVWWKSEKTGVVDEK